MSDFPGVATTASSILSTLDQTHHAHVWPTANPTAGAVWPAANRAIYVPVLVEDVVKVTQMAILPTVASGNFDIGIYSETGSLLVSKGSTAVGTANTVQAVDITDTVLAPGVYFFALNIDNTTAAVQRSSTTSAGYAQACGVQQQAVGAVALPSTATFANPASAYVPLVQAISMSAVI